MSLLASLQAQAAALATLEPDVRADAHDAVHQMRVSARTLRTNLRTFQDVLPGEKKRLALIEELGWLGDALGPAREAEVLAAQVLGLLERTPPEYVLGPVRARVEAVFGLERESAIGLRDGRVGLAAVSQATERPRGLLRFGEAREGRRPVPACIAVCVSGCTRRSPCRMAPSATKRCTRHARPRAKSATPRGAGIVDQADQGAAGCARRGTRPSGRRVGAHRSRRRRAPGRRERFYLWRTARVGALRFSRIRPPGQTAWQTAQPILRNAVRRSCQTSTMPDDPSQT